jgi:hypothetical protein
MNNNVSILFLLVACGGGGSTATPDAAQLRCTDFAYCSTYSVKRYQGTVDTPAGGTIRDGTYRLAWQVDPTTVTDSGTHEYAKALRIVGNQFVDGEFGYRGTLAIDGTTLTFNGVAHCSMGSESEGTNTTAYQFTANDDQLILFSTVTRSDGQSWKRESVFVRTDNVCQTVNSVPASPGDSYTCTVTNCVCRSAIGNTVASCT